MNALEIETKINLVKEIIADECTARDFMDNFLCDGETHIIQQMIDEASRPASKCDFAEIGRLFKKAFDESINDYVSLQG